MAGLALVDEVRDAYLQFTGVEMPIGFLTSHCHTALQETMATVEDLLATTSANKYQDDEAEEGEDDDNGALDTIKGACSKITDFFTGGAVKIASDDDNVDMDTDHAIDAVLLETLKRIIKRAGLPSQRTGVKIKMIELGRLVSKLEQFMDEDACEPEIGEDGEDGEDDEDEEDEEDEEEDREELIRELRELHGHTDSMIGHTRKKEESNDSDGDAELMAKKYKRLRR